MNQKSYRVILFSVGSLPFWTGKKKLIKLLIGDPGSYWDHETPLKPVYLNQPFFGELSNQSTSTVRQGVQKLLTEQYLIHEAISDKKPYKVVKFSHKGVKKYYNLLVTERDLSEPHWWLHHVSRLRKPTNSAITTGGEICPYNEKLYLTQTPGYLEATQRMQSDQTIQVKNTQHLENETGHFHFRGLNPMVEDYPVLKLTEQTEVERISSSDLNKKLNHFSTFHAQTNPPNPYVIQGKLKNKTKPGENNLRTLEFHNSEDKTLKVKVRTNQIPDELTLQIGQSYVLGPLAETDDETGSFELKLEESGDIQPHRP